jgi:hypothetical protein
MADNFLAHNKGLDAPCDRHFAITPNDDANLTDIPRAIYCQSAGNAVIRDKFGTDLTYALTAGQILPFRGVRILATGTTATIYGWE